MEIKGLVLASEVVVILSQCQTQPQQRPLSVRGGRASVSIFVSASVSLRHRKFPLGPSANK